MEEELVAPGGHLLDRVGVPQLLVRFGLVIALGVEVDVVLVDFLAGRLVDPDGAGLVDVDVPQVWCLLGCIGRDCRAVCGPQIHQRVPLAVTGGRFVVEQDEAACGVVRCGSGGLGALVDAALESGQAVLEAESVVEDLLDCIGDPRLGLCGVFELGQNRGPFEGELTVVELAAGALGSSCSTGLFDVGLGDVQCSRNLLHAQSQIAQLCNGTGALATGEVFALFVGIELLGDALDVCCTLVGVLVTHHHRNGGQAYLSGGEDTALPVANREGPIGAADRRNRLQDSEFCDGGDEIGCCGDVDARADVGADVEFVGIGVDEGVSGRGRCR